MYKIHVEFSKEISVLRSPTPKKLVKTFFTSVVDVGPKASAKSTGQIMLTFSPNCIFHKNSNTKSYFEIVQKLTSFWQTFSIYSI